MTKSTRLDQVCQLIMGQAPDGISYNTAGVGHPLIAGAGDFNEGRPEPTKFTSEPTKLSKSGDIILGIRASIGEKVLSDGIYCLGRGVAGLRPHTQLDGRFLWHWLTHITPVLMSKAKGATFKQVNREDIGELDIDLPPLPEQRRIAAILDQAEALRTQRRAALAKLDTLAQSIFIEMFGDPLTVLGKWPITKLGHILEFLTSGSRGWATHYSESGDLFLRIQNVRRDELDLEDVAFVAAPDTAEARRTRVEPGDVLLSITADLGRTAVIPEGIGIAYINQHLSIIRQKELVPRFLSAFLASPMGQQQVLGRNKQGVKAGLNFDDIRSITIPLPPMPLQKKYAERLQAIEGEQAKHRSSLITISKLFASIQHRAFRAGL